MRTENPEPPEGAPGRRGRGRPRRWPDDRARQQHHRQTVAQQQALVRELIAAARNARWSEPLHQQIQFGDDTEVLEALITHYRSRHWGRCRAAGPEEGGPEMDG